MLIFSLIFISLMVLLVFCLSKDTGYNTVHARKEQRQRNAIEHNSVERRRYTDTNVLSTN